MPNRQMIIDAYHALERAQRAYGWAGYKVANAKADLERAEAGALVQGVAGKNEAERKATLRLMLAEDYAELTAAETTEREMRLDLDLARIEVERVKALLRLAELQAQAAALGNPSAFTGDPGLEYIETERAAGDGMAGYGGPH